jgi:hypothetical protein
VKLERGKERRESRNTRGSKAAMSRRRIMKEGR